MLLKVENVVRTFGGVRAVDGASFAVERGSITSLIGPNGAGKSTVFNIVAGYRRDSGPCSSTGGGSTGCRRTVSRGSGSRAPSRPRGRSAG